MPSRYQAPSREFHIVVLGSGGVGKSCLTTQFVHNEWIESYDPTIEDSYRTQVSVDGRQLVLEILDTAGTEQFVAMRDLYMKTGQGFLLVFSITSKASLAEVAILRDEIIRIKEDDKAPIVIVGNKSDLEDQRRVERARAFSLSQRWEHPYYETSARTRTNVDEVFIDLCRQWLRRDSSPSDWRDDELAAKHHSTDQGSSSSTRKKRKKKKEGKCVIL